MKRWNILSEFNPKVPVINQILKNRGITDIKGFVNFPTVSEYFSKLPQELKDGFNQAKEIVLKSIKENRTIVIYGDYDVDGICSTAILYNTIKDGLGYSNLTYFIPNRFEHGYGLSAKAIDTLISEHKLTNALFITLDTGITAQEEVKKLKDLGHSVDIVDHHQKPDILPGADCIVWYDVVVATTLSWLLSKHLGSKDSQYISLAALATVTDVQPLLGFNRTIVKAGLDVMNSNPLPGIKELMKISGRKDSVITTYDLGWVLGPRLNASGRMVDASDSLSLFIEKDPEKITESAQKLNSLNEDRQDKTTSMYEIASIDGNSEIPKIIISSSSDYHEGIIGLVAARLAQKYYRPSIVVSLSDGFGKGSVRSIKGFDVTAFLRKFEELFINLGGHPMAAGFSIEESKLGDLQKRINENINSSLPDELLIPELQIDLKIPASVVDINFFNELEKMKPFGMGNEEPAFLSENFGVAEVNSIGKENQHVRFKLYSEGKYYKAIYFDSSEKTKDIKFGDKVDVVYTLKKNEYNGSVYLDLIVKDLKPSI